MSVITPFFTPYGSHGKVFNQKHKRAVNNREELHNGRDHPLSMIEYEQPFYFQFFKI